MNEKLRREIGWEKEPPAGAIFHAAGFDETGRIHVADVWESEDAFNSFVEKRLVPAMKKLGVPTPDVTIFPAHNVNAYAAIEKHRV